MSPQTVLHVCCNPWVAKPSNSLSKTATFKKTIHFTSVIQPLSSPGPPFSHQKHSKSIEFFNTQLLKVSTTRFTNVNYISNSMSTKNYMQKTVYKQTIYGILKSDFGPTVSSFFCCFFVS